MGTNELRLRQIWQDDSGKKADIAEKSFYKAFTEAFIGTEYEVISKPKEFNNIYSKIILDDAVLAEIYTPEGQTWVHGLLPDYAIRNKKTNKTIYIEVKRQDGWVEGKPRSAGRGNAHERSNKFFTPGLLKALRSRGHLGNDILPFWVVFQGDIARDPKRVREITFWYEGFSDHFFMWRDNNNPKPLVDHFTNKIKHLLD